MTPRLADRLAHGRLLPEATLAGLACWVFLGSLGSVELWGKREQRAAAESIDTVDHGHWLVARIQGRPRLEKPPLPRWVTAALIKLTGRRSESVVRLPGGVAALATVALVYGLGRRLGGRSVGLAAALALTSMGLFITELRQAGNDGPLALFVTLALYAAWRRLHGGDATDDGSPVEPGPPRWNLVMFGALGLGFLTKGPVILPIVLTAVVPYLAFARRLRRGVALLADGRGALLFLALAASWPVPVLLREPDAARVWWLEIGQKVGLAGVGHNHLRLPLVADWPLLTAPWTLLATVAVVQPVLRRPGSPGDSPRAWYFWWWGVGNLAMFSAWPVAKPSYFVPCLPGLAVLTGWSWVRLVRRSRDVRGGGAFARRVVLAHWLVPLAVAAALPAVLAWKAPDAWGWGVVASLTLGVAVGLSVLAWVRGGDWSVLAPLVGAAAVMVSVFYGAVAPTQNASRGHRALAESLDRLLPPDARTVMFYRELDEGLGFYLRGREILAVPGSQPRFNRAHALVDELAGDGFRWDATERLETQQRALLDWLCRPDRGSSFVILTEREFSRLPGVIHALVEPVYGERRLSRTALVLLRVSPRPAGSGVELPGS
jgi:4-amino-4-deoxy-L-arabinose transferase-like glycosyltransferase